MFAPYSHNNLFSLHLNKLREDGFPDIFASPSFDYSLTNCIRVIKRLRQSVDDVYNDQPKPNKLTAATTTTTACCDLEDCFDMCMTVTCCVEALLENPSSTYNMLCMLIDLRLYALQKTKQRAALNIDDDADSIHEFRRWFKQQTQTLKPIIEKRFPGKVLEGVFSLSVPAELVHRNLLPTLRPPKE